MFEFIVREDVITGEVILSRVEFDLVMSLNGDPDEKNGPPPTLPPRTIHHLRCIYCQSPNEAGEISCGNCNASLGDADQNMGTLMDIKELYIDQRMSGVRDKLNISRDKLFELMLGVIYDDLPL